jgi:hypothetical protein
MQNSEGHNRSRPAFHFPPVAGRVGHARFRVLAQLADGSEVLIGTAGSLDDARALTRLITPGGQVGTKIVPETATVPARAAGESRISPRAGRSAQVGSQRSRNWSSFGYDNLV